MLQELHGFLQAACLALLMAQGMSFAWSGAAAPSYSRRCCLSHGKPLQVPVFAGRNADGKNSVDATVVATYGFHSQELPFLMELVKSACDGLGFSCSVDMPHAVVSKEDSPSQQLVGPTGRILILHISSALSDEDTLDELNQAMATLVDDDLYSESPILTNPFLSRFELDRADLPSIDTILDQVVQEGELRIPLARSSQDEFVYNISFVPSAVIEVDGAFVQEPGSSGPVWDTSQVQIFDGLVDNSLRKRLAMVVAGGKDLTGDQGPDLRRWGRGALSDRMDADPPMASFGLALESIRDLCDNHHEAIEEMECIISELFSDFIVSRLPEAVYGMGVSPLTANAPVAGDTFDFHIDADPATAPPSLWTDVYGRYPNRSRSKPRFVSLLVYINDEWHEEWEGPTRFLDFQTGTEYAVIPRPGRCIVMDQDVSHSVTAPSSAAGKRPRYSLVWKLVLHPSRPGQDMRDLSCGRQWPKPILLGTANPVITQHE